jgi:hypothetical protein
MSYELFIWMLLVGNRLGKRNLENLDVFRRIIIKMDLSEVGLEGEHLICLVQDRDK